MHVPLTRRRVVVGVVLILGAALIAVELFLLSADVRLLAVAGAETLGADEFLAARLDDRDLRVRKCAADALARRGMKAVPVLEAMLSDPKPGNRRIAAASLARIGTVDVAAYPTLLRVAVEDPDDGVLETSGQALGKVARDDPRIVAELLVMMESSTDAKRLAAIRAAARLEDARALGPLVAALKYDNPRIREEAAESLGEMGALATPATVALLAATEDPVPAARREAARSLGKVLMAAPPGAIPAELQTKARAAVDKVLLARPASPKTDDDD
jgi:HEAT repeat protein